MKHFDYMERVEEIYAELSKNDEITSSDIFIDELANIDYEQFLDNLNKWLETLKYPYFQVDGTINLWNGPHDINMIVKLENINDFLNYIVDGANNIAISFDDKKGIIKIKKDHHDGTNYYTLYNLGENTKEELKQLLLDISDDIELIKEDAQYYFGKPLSRLTKEELMELLYELYGYKL